MIAARALSSAESQDLETGDEMSVAAVVTLMLAAGPAPSSVSFEQTTTAHAGGKPVGPGVTARVWYAGTRMRLEPGNAPAGTALLLRLDQGKAWRLEPAQKQAIELDLGRLRDQSQMDVSMAGQLMGLEGGGVRTEALPATKLIDGFRCKGYRLTAGSAVLEVYLTRRIPAGVEAFTDFLEWSGAAQAMGSLMAELKKLPGFPLEMRSRVNVLGEIHETVSTVSKVKVGPLADSLFTPPAGWPVVPESETDWQE
jgi:hypothetical protein